MVWPRLAWIGIVKERLRYAAQRRARAKKGHDWIRICAEQIEPHCLGMEMKTLALIRLGMVQRLNDMHGNGMDLSGETRDLLRLDMKRKGRAWIG